MTPFVQDMASNAAPPNTSSQSAFPSEILIAQNTSGTPLHRYYVVNNTITGDSPRPDTMFPFTNVAVTIPSGIASTQVFMYHQLNESAFAEETWDYDLGLWNTEIVQVDTST